MTEKMLVNKKEAANRIGVSTTTLTLILEMEGEPKPVRNKLYYFAAIEQYFIKTSQGGLEQKDPNTQEYWNELAKKRVNSGNDQGQISRH